MIRVLHVVHAMNCGGIETLLMNIYRNIDRSKIQFDFLLHTDEECYYNEEIRSLGGQIYCIPSRREGIWKNIRALDVFLEKHKEYKIIHQHVSSLSYIEPTKRARKKGVPVRIIHGHNIQEGGSKIHEYIHKINRLNIHKNATDYFACSKLVAEWMYSKKQYRYQEYNIINNAIQTEQFTFSEEIRKQKREELNIQDKFVIGHVGRFNEQKNHGFLLDIFKEIYNQNKKAVLLLVGDGKLRGDIQEKVERLDLENQVIFMGVRSDVAELFQAMDAFVFPSLYEGLGIVLIEAQASGLKCFTSAKVVPEEVDVTGNVEFIALDKSSEEWASEILKSAYYIRENMKDKIIQGGYDLYHIVKQLEQWYSIKQRKN